jgi:Aspartyl protease
MVLPLILGCTALFSWTSVSAAESKNCQLKRYTSIDFAGPPDGNLLVPVTISGTPAYMVLDLASPLSRLTPSAVNSLSLPTKPVPSQLGIHAGAKQIEKMATATQFELGGLRYKSADFLVLSSEPFGLNLIGPPVVGYLGMDMFVQADIELDLAHRKMNLFSQDHCPDHTVYWSATYDFAPIRFGNLGEFYFPMELDGKKIETTLSTTHPATTLRTDASKKLYNFDKQSTDLETETDAAGNITSHYRAMKMRGQGIEIMNARVLLIDPIPGTNCSLSSNSGAASYADCYGIHPLALGRNVLSKLHFYIATKEKVLYFTPASVSEPP